MKTTCPACGSDTLSKTTKEAYIPVEFGRNIRIDETIYVCEVCGTDGDFADENDKIIERALEVAKQKSTELILDGLANNRVSMAYFERAMGLPTRTLARWKQGNISASGFALLKTVETFPWILEVADERFDKCFAINKLIQKASEALQEAVVPHILCSEQSVTSDGHTATLSMSITLNKNINSGPVIINSLT